MVLMEKTCKSIPWLSGGLATLAAFFIAAVEIPNTQKLVVDHSVYPLGTHFEPQPAVVLQILLAAFLPVLCIFTLGRRWIFFDWVAWIFLAMLLARIF